MTSKVKQATQFLAFSILIGLIAGLVTTLFGKILLEVGDLRSEFFTYLIPFLPLAGLVIVFVYQKWGREVQAGMGLVFKAGQGENVHISPVLVPLIISTTWLSHLFGASVGREGVAVQLGASLSHWLQKQGFKDLPKDMVTKIGMAAGFAGLFQTPLAASFFAIEVLIVGQYTWTSLPYCLVAAFTASTTSYFLGLEKFSHAIVTTSFQFTDSFKWTLIAICFGFVGNLFAWFLAQAKNISTRLLPNPYIKIAIMGIELSILLFYFHQGRYAGLGTNLIEVSLAGEQVFAYDWLLKLLLTCLCLAAGFQGGEVTPLFAIGVSSGAVLAGLLGLPTELVAALGYCAVFGTATNTLLAPIIIGYEVFGANLIPYAIPVLAIAYLVNRKQTIYGQQIRK
ncbi:TPA: chloride channel protein [Streptococcus suis]|nr:chloride channel protein [Streptococcus suis]HEM6137514.1 chloride channel protein [Streptococcus suis]HEM6266737.1 chloride channel protein [Streptococcus suis]HEM6320801.1 chloride channel protein [Streptococcus suis]